jgi:hypothetical protein
MDYKHNSYAFTEAGKVLDEVMQGVNSHIMQKELTFMIDPYATEWFIEVLSNLNWWMYTLPDDSTVNTGFQRIRERKLGDDEFDEPFRSIKD